MSVGMALQANAVLQIAEKGAFELGNGLGRIDEAVGLKIQEHAAVVQVRTAHRGPFAIDQYHFRMQHPLGVLVHLNPGLQDVVPVVTGRKIRNPLVRVVQAQKPHVHAQEAGQAESVEQPGVGNKIGGGDPQSPSSAQDGSEVDFPDTFFFAIGTGLDDLYGIGPI